MDGITEKGSRRRGGSGHSGLQHWYYLEGAKFVEAKAATVDINCASTIGRRPKKAGALCIK